MKNYAKSFLNSIKVIVIILANYACTDPTHTAQEEHNDNTPTDSSSISFQTSERLPLSEPLYFLEGTWLQASDSSTWTFNGRELHRRKQQRKTRTIFARYNLPPIQGGYYDSLGSFLVLGTGRDSIICYKIVQLTNDSLIMKQENIDSVLIFTKVD